MPEGMILVDTECTNRLSLFSLPFNGQCISPRWANRRGYDIGIDFSDHKTNASVPRSFDAQQRFSPGRQTGSPGKLINTVSTPTLKPYVSGVGE